MKALTNQNNSSIIVDLSEDEDLDDH